MDYYRKYRYYKNKYLNLINQNSNRIKSKNLNKIQRGGIKNVGLYELDGTKYISAQTIGGAYFSYYKDFLLNIDENDKTTNLHKPDKDKVLVIDSTYLFDYFTNKYGQLKRGGFRDGEYIETTIFIDWDKVANDYKGFYLDYENEELRLFRYSRAVLKRKQFLSWWQNEYHFKNVLIFSK
jgi:hypothetical protein